MLTYRSQKLGLLRCYHWYPKYMDHYSHEISATYSEDRFDLFIVLYENRRRPGELDTVGLFVAVAKVLICEWREEYVQPRWAPTVRLQILSASFGHLKLEITLHYEPHRTSAASYHIQLEIHIGRKEDSAQFQFNPTFRRQEAYLIAIDNKRCSSSEALNGVRWDHCARLRKVGTAGH